MSRRKRCSGPCGELYPPERLARVGGREALCPDCLILAAVELAPAEITLDSSGFGPSSEQPKAEARAPEPLPLRDEEERFAGLISYDVEGWPLRKGRLSASALGCYLRCPEQFRREYVKGQKRPSGGTALAGTGAHGAVEAALRFRVSQGEDASPAQVSDTFDAVFEAAVLRARDREGIEWGKADKRELDFDSTLELGRKAVAAYATSPAFQHLEPVELEHVFALIVPGVPVPFCGLIDVLTSRGESVDLKFGANCQSRVMPDWRVQSLIYGLATRRSPAFHSISWAGKVQGPSEAPGLRLEWDARQSIVAARMARSVVSSILADAERLGPDEPWLGNVTHTWACGACSFRPECAWWNVPDSELLL